MLVSYYLPGNSLAPPPSHRASGATAQVVVEHAILGSVIFHPTWAVAGRWSTLILPFCDPPRPVCGHYNDAPSYFHCLAMKSAHWSQYCKHHCSCTHTSSLVNAVPWIYPPIWTFKQGYLTMKFEGFVDSLKILQHNFRLP